MNYSYEKLEYLRKYTKLSPITTIKLNKLKQKGVSQEEINQAEYIYRFQSYEKIWEKEWKKTNWGQSEDESLSEYANTALEQIVNSEKGRTR